MGLEAYNKKRKFDKTTEPKGKHDASNKSRFVIQRHQASRLHYDLRLEMGGVLKSWAVPKGPSLNPDDKRLAVETEDHPVKYLTFEGDIPKGNYGAGHMDIWDSGTYAVKPSKKAKTAEEQYEKGDLKLIFKGDKIKGDFALVKTNYGKEKNNWLLIKKDDDFAVDEPYDAEDFAEPAETPPTAEQEGEDPWPENVKPMLATTATRIFDDKDWIYEMKWDGYRTLAFVRDANVELRSRNGLSLGQKFPSIAGELETLGENAVLDGEVVYLDEQGYPRFQKLQNYEDADRDRLFYYVFDLLYLNGYSTVGMPLIERKEVLRSLLSGLDTDRIRYCDHVETLGTALYEKAVQSGFEGVIAKKARSVYHPGARSDSWLKFKNIHTREAIICGYTETEAQEFGSLILGAYQDGELTYIGNCGTGFFGEERVRLLKEMKSLARKTTPFSSVPNLKGRRPQWVSPRLICEVKFSEITDQGMLRHPVYLHLRDDKQPDEITPPEKQPDPMKKADAKAKESVLEIDGQKVEITHPAKVYFPGEGIRKFELIDYYIQVADTILPHLMDRPQNMHRHPDGIEEPGFYQKDNDHLPDWVKTKSIHSKSTGKDIDYLLCQNEATLVYMANLGCIELNPWISTVDDIDHPTYAILDIDPTDKTPFKEVVEVALVAKEILDHAKVKAYCKTSGSTGLHVYIPLGGDYDYDEARSFVKLICHFVNEKLPKTTSMERSIKARKGKIYLDYMQNKIGQTLAAPYCVRPKPGATVSAPLHWKEVDDRLKISDFNIHNMVDRIKKEGDLFAPVLSEKTDVGKAIERLETLD